MHNENQNEDADDCPICLGQVGISHAVMCSNQHKVCAPCFVEYIQSGQKIDCPLCRLPSQFPSQKDSRDRLVYYTQQKRNRYIQIGERKLQVIFQGKKISEVRAKRLLCCAVNLISYMLKHQAEEDEQMVTFECEAIDVEICLVKDIVSINF